MKRPKYAQKPDLPPLEKAIINHTADKVARAPIAPPKITEETSAMMETARAPYKIGLILCFVGAGLLLLDMWACLFLPVFTLVSLLSLAIAGLLLLVGGALIITIRKPNHRERRKQKPLA